MAVFKCKMCGGDLEIIEDSKVAECSYCGTRQTVPAADNEKKMSLFARANKLRAACDFDKAAGVYESIVTEFPDEAESYWGLILCKYGIEYVDDPISLKKIPTCHRSSFDVLFDTNDFEMVMENADSASRRVYREEAKVIEELRKSIVEISAKEEPYDIFICYKETDENGSRTIDSVIAQDVYNELTEKGYRVFFSRITLEDKLGQEYEPYIFAALNSAKIMLAFGTDYEYYNAVWVKNEWSRFLQLIAKGEKKILIPCYKNIDAYDMPREFAKLQSQDMGKVGATQDLLRGIAKILPKNEPVKEKEVIVKQNSGPNVEAMLKRGFMSLEDAEWEKAKTFFDQVLNIDAECAEAYLGLAMADCNNSTRKAFMYSCRYSNKNYIRAKQFADSSFLDELLALEKEALQAQLKNIFVHLEKEDWKSAVACCDKVLFVEPESADAYLGKLMAGLMVKAPEELKNLKAPFYSDESYQMFLKLADDERRNEIKGYHDIIVENMNKAAMQRRKYCEEQIEGLKALKESGRLPKKLHSCKDLSDELAELDECMKSYALSREELEILHKENKERLNALIIERSSFGMLVDGARKKAIDMEIERIRDMFRGTSEFFNRTTKLKFRRPENLDEAKKYRQELEEEIRIAKIVEELKSDNIGRSCLAAASLF